jgi:hypothetical protein
VTGNLGAPVRCSVDPLYEAPPGFTLTRQDYVRQSDAEAGTATRDLLVQADCLVATGTTKSRTKGAGPVVARLKDRVLGWHDGVMGAETGADWPDEGVYHSSVRLWPDRLAAGPEPLILGFRADVELAALEGAGSDRRLCSAEGWVVDLSEGVAAAWNQADAISGDAEALASALFALDKPEHADRWPASLAILVERVSVASPDLRGYGLVPYMVLEAVRLLGLGHEQLVVTMAPDADDFDGDDEPASLAAATAPSAWWGALGFGPSRPGADTWLAFGSDLRAVERATVLRGRFAEYYVDLWRRR